MDLCCSAKELCEGSARFDAKRGESKAFENATVPLGARPKPRLSRFGVTGSAPRIVPTLPAFCDVTATLCEKFPCSKFPRSVPLPPPWPKFR
jgi:hypothetical protein